VSEGSENCSTCLYFVHVNNAWSYRSGTCRRYPPVAYKIFPPVESDSWCGEFKKGKKDESKDGKTD